MMKISLYQRHNRNVRNLSVLSLCTSVQQQTPMGRIEWEESSDRRGGRRKGPSGRHGVEPVSLCCDADGVAQGAEAVAHMCE